MARAQDAPMVTGGQVDPFVQQSLMQDKQLANNRLVAAMQERGATNRQAMAGKQATSQQQTAIAAQTTADDKRAAEAERARREDAAEQKRQFDESQSLTERLKDKQLSLEKAISDRDFEQADRLHGELMAERRVAQRMEAEQARATNKAILAQFGFVAKKDLAIEKQKTAIEETKGQIDRDRTAHEKLMSRTKENILADKRFGVFEMPERPGFFQTITPIGAIMTGVKGTRKLLEQSTEDVIGTIQRYASANGSKIEVSDLTASGYVALEQKVAAGEISEIDIRTMYGTLEAGKEAIRKKLDEASESQAKKWNLQLLRLGGAETTLDRLKTSQVKKVGDETSTVGSISRKGLDVVQESGYPGIISRFFKGTSASEESLNLFLAEQSKALEVPARMPYGDDDDDYTRKRIDEVNMGRGFDLSSPSVPIEEPAFSIVRK